MATASSRSAADAEVLALASDATERIDLAGRVVIPGLNDAHVHTAAPLPAHDLGLPFDPPVADVLDAIRRGVEATSPGTWLEGTIGGAVFDDAAMRRARARSRGARPSRPAPWAGPAHGRLLNTAALRALDLDRRRPAGFAGWIEQDAAGAPTGLFHGYEGFRIAAARTRPAGDDESVAAFQAFAHEALSYGITSVQQMAMPYSIEKSVAVLARAQVPLRWRLIDFPLEGPERFAPAPAGAAAAERDRQRRQVDLRRHARGALDGDARAVRGPAGLERAALPRPRTSCARRSQATLARGEQLIVHAVGDRAIENVLAAMEAAAAAGALAASCARASSTATACAATSCARVAALGVTVVQNPSHFTIVDLVDRRLGRDAPVRAEFQPFRSLIAAGIPIAIGSDGPLNPFLNIMFAVRHPINPAEALTVEQAVTAYTVGSARAELREQEKGALRPGLLADLAVLSQDIFTVAPRGAAGDRERSDRDRRPDRVSPRRRACGRGAVSRSRSKIRRRSSACARRSRDVPGAKRSVP